VAFFAIRDPLHDLVATLEAIARALAIFEGDEVRERLEMVFRSMVERTLWTRGEFPAADVCGGIPEGAQNGIRETGSP
jgi:hypothetical protein